MKVGYLGPKGTFSYEICNQVYSENDDKRGFRTIKDMIQAIEKASIEEAIVPIENSLQGCVTETIDNLILSKNIKIYSEEILKINQNLMARKKYKLSEINQIYSHPQALAQCRNFLQEKVKNAEIIEISSTALAAKEVSKKNNVACICNIECLKEYNLQLIQERIQDNDWNETKFWRLVEKKSNKEERNSDKMTMIFETEDKPGALYHVLSIFENHNINLTKIESRPTKEKLGQYYFWVEMEVKNENYEKVLEELSADVTFFKVLGKYRNKRKVGENRNDCRKDAKYGKE